MSVATQQQIETALGLSALTSQAQQAWDWAEQAILEYLGLDFIEQQSVTEWGPLDESNAFTNDPVYVLNSAASKAVPGFFWSPRVMILSNTPVRSITEIREDPTGYFGQEPGSFGTGTILTVGSDYFLEYEQSGICWSGRLVRRAFWFPMTIGSLQVTYTAGFTAAEFTGRYKAFPQAVCIAAQHEYLRMMAVSGGQMPDISSEGLGGGASTFYREAFTYGEAIPDRACDLLSKYASFNNQRL